MTTQVKPPKVTARGVAITALMAAEEGERANLIVPRLLSASGLDERDRSFVTELAYGTLRMCRACDWLVDQFARGELEPVVRAAARAGAYQLAFMRVPSYAAVSATVSEVPPRARSLLNAVLRRVAALAEAGPLAWPDLGTRLSYPDWVIRRLGEDLGPERAMGALDQMNIAASQTIRADGYTQDPGSQAVAEHMTELMGANPGPVLDVCSAPGGKATLLAGSAAFVVGADLAPQRARQVAGNAERLGLRNLSVVVADGTEPPFRAAQFADDVGRLAALQRRLLGSVAGLVAPGGVLVYSVCTLTRAETEDVSSWLARELGSGWEVLGPPGPPWEPHGQGAILLPQSVGTDGMYLSAYRRLAA